MAASWVLYQYPGGEGLPSASPPCAKVYLALRRLGLPHEVLDLRPEQVSSYSPTGRMPALRTPEGRTVIDSVRILDLLEQAPGQVRPLAPRDPAARATDRLWEHFANDTLYWCLVVDRWLVPANRARMLPLIAGRSKLRQTLAGAIGGRIAGQRARGQGTGLKTPEEVRDDWARHLRVLVDGLGGGPYLLGREEPGRGDLAVATLLAQVGWGGATPALAAALAEHPPLRAHARRVFEACDWTPPAWL